MKLGIELKSPWEAIGVPSFKFDLQTAPFKPARKETLVNTSDDEERARYIKRSAEQDAKRGLPSTDDLEPNHRQRELLLLYHKDSLHIDSVVNANIEAFRADFQRLDELKVDSDRLVSIYKQQLKAYLAAQRVTAIEVVRRFHLVDERLRVFKEKHNLERDAILMSNDLSGWIFVASIATFEFMVSVALFSVAMPNGAPEAVAMLLPVAVINIFLGVGAGFYASRLIFLTKKLWKWVAAFIFMLSFSLSFYLNLIISKLRDYVSDKSGTSILSALQETLGNSKYDVSEIKILPFELHNVESFVFLLLGILTWSIALWKGINGFDDLVPGYRLISTQHYNYRIIREKYFDKLRNRVHHANTLLIRSLVEQMRQTSNGVNELESQFVEQKQSFIIAISSNKILREHVVSMIKYYREINRHLRRQFRWVFFKPIAPEPPRYFSEITPALTAPTASYDRLEADFTSMRARAKATLLNLDKVVTDLSTEMGMTAEYINNFEKEIENSSSSVVG